MSRTFEDPLLRRIYGILRDEVDPEFEFASPGPIPWCPAPASPLGFSVALITTAGLHVKDDPPFRAMEERLGDTGFRVIPRGTPPDALDLSAPYVDQRHIPQDPEVALPLVALEALHRVGTIGPPAPRHVSVSGGIVRPFPGLAESGEKVAKILGDDGVSAVLLLPSCPLCVQTVSILARSIEARGIPTACLTLVPELTRIVGAPRSLHVRFRFGAPCGDPGNGPLHRAVLLELLGLLTEAKAPGTVRESDLKWKCGEVPRRS
jgi:D-proline reductase (dithiol) PrdB